MITYKHTERQLMTISCLLETNYYFPMPYYNAYYDVKINKSMFLYITYVYIQSL